MTEGDRPIPIPGRRRIYEKAFELEREVGELRIRLADMEKSYATAVEHVSKSDALYRKTAGRLADVENDDLLRRRAIREAIFGGPVTMVPDWESLLGELRQRLSTPKE